MQEKTKVNYKIKKDKKFSKNILKIVYKFVRCIYNIASKSVFTLLSGGCHFAKFTILRLPFEIFAVKPINAERLSSIP